MSVDKNKAGGGSIHERIGLLYAWALLIVVFLIVKPAVFGSFNIYASILGGQSAVVMLTLALIVPLAAGEFDLSAAAMLALSAMIIAVLNVDMGVPVGLAILAAVREDPKTATTVALTAGLLGVAIGWFSFVVRGGFTVRRCRRQGFSETARFPVPRARRLARAR